jgi:ATP-binding cassette subfamily B protein
MLAMDCTWSRPELAEGLAALARASGIAHASTGTCEADRIDESTIELASFFRQQAQALDVRIEPAGTRYGMLSSMLRDAAPAVVRVKVDGAERFVLLLGSRGSQLKVLGRDLGEHRVSCAILTDAIAAPVIAWMKTDVDGCIRDAAISKKRRAQARNAMLAACLRDIDLGSTWLLRPASTSPMGQTLRRDGIKSRASLFIATHFGQFLVGLLVWAFVGRLAFGSDHSTAWLWALGLALLTLVPLQLWNMWAAGLISLDFGVRLKQRLLVGAFNLPFEHIRAGGIGEHLSRVFESDGFEALVLSGATAGLMAIVQLLVAAAIIAFGVGSLLQAGLVLLWMTLACGLFQAYMRRRRHWAQMRLALTNSMVERLVGQQTRLAQESETEWHRSEDAGLAAYHAASRDMDRWQLLLSVVVVRGWLPVGLAGLAHTFVQGGASEVKLAVSLGAVLLVQQAIGQLVNSGIALADAYISWRLVGPLFRAAGKQSETTGSIRAQNLLGKSSAAQEAKREVLLDAQGLGYSYDDRALTVLDDCNCVVHNGDRILLEGSSGGGKSTLAAILAGLRPAKRGTILLHGLDRQTIGDLEWRRRVVLAPQFHENHILTGTLAFNLLMGRGWPASPDDLLLADAICRDLELGPLLVKMPNGIHQVVGETGWQLSHGERSRVFLARALLQQADVLILDESFAALDPQTLQICLRVLMKQQRTVILIAHP